jgi:hypothetical protein
MAKPTQVEFESQVVDADILESESLGEPWSTYRLEDGTIIKCKQILVSVARLRGKYKENGEPIYVLKMGGLVDAEIPRELFQARR